MIRQIQAKQVIRQIQAKQVIRRIQAKQRIQVRPQEVVVQPILVKQENQMTHQIQRIPQVVIIMDLTILTYPLIPI